VAGTFAYTPAAGTVLAAGSQTLSATLTPTDTADYNSATATVTLLVSKATPTISLSPTAATLSASQTIQLSATVVNTSNTAVTWAITPAGTGSISGAGVYTAPATISTTQTITVTATSSVDATQSASATITLVPGQCSVAGYNYQRSLTINHLMIPNTDQVDYPMLVSGTYPFLASIASGGQVQNAQGYDIIFTSDAAGQSPLDFEIDSYNGTTGTAAFWVRIPLLSHTTDTTIYMWYGNSSITSSQENIAGVWRNNYLSVYHLGNGSSIGMMDSGSAGYTLAASGSVAPVSGVIGGGAGFSGDPSVFLYRNSVTTYPSGSTQPVTLEAWEQISANTSGG
jgi:hypothetical protein